MIWNSDMLRQITWEVDWLIYYIVRKFKYLINLNKQTDYHKSFMRYDGWMYRPIHLKKLNGQLEY